MGKYAENTSVSSEMSRLEIERTLIRYGATGFVYAIAEAKAMVGFLMNGKQVKFILPLPPMEDFRYTPTGRDRTEKSKMDAREQACRQRWRALHLVIKAKLEAVESGISIFENEFMANIVLPDGTTAGDFMLPQINQAYETSEMPKLLPHF